MNFASIGPLDLQVALLVDSIWRPFRAQRPFRARRSEVIVPGLKPWAEFSSPFGACPSALGMTGAKHLLRGTKHPEPPYYAKQI